MEILKYETRFFVQKICLDIELKMKEYNEIGST